jgi:hypothetical protein
VFTKSEGLEKKRMSGLSAPSGLMLVRGISQDKPWAKLSWPLRATDWKRPNYKPNDVVSGATRETLVRAEPHLPEASPSLELVPNKLNLTLFIQCSYREHPLRRDNC